MNSVTRLLQRSETGVETWKASWTILNRKWMGMYPVWIVSWLAFLLLDMLQKQTAWWRLPEVLLTNVTSLLMLTGLGLSDGIVITYSWYVPTMLLAMAVLLPMICSNPKRFVYCIAPLITVFGLAWMWKQYGMILPLNEDWLGVTYGKTIRALAGISLGCISFEISRAIGKNAERVTPKGRLVMTVLGLGAIGIPLFWMTVRMLRPRQIPGLVLFAIGVAIMFSDTGYFHCMLKGRLWRWLGKYSFALYLGQGIAQKVMADYHGVLSTKVFAAVYVAMALAVGAVIHLLAGLMSKGWEKAGLWVKKIMFQ